MIKVNTKESDSLANSEKIPTCRNCGEQIETDLLDGDTIPNLCNNCYHGDSLDEF